MAIEGIICLRRWFHSHPEVGFEEYETAEKVASVLKELGLKVQTGVGKTGVVGILQGELEGGVLGIRADMDALPIQEETGLSYASENKGVMHACGHDSHIAIVLGTAIALAMRRRDLKGTVKFIFQPSEERLSGARAMIDDGVLDNPKVDVLIGLHNWPSLPTGVVGIKEGPLMGAVDRFSFVLKGIGGHGAIPNKAIDPIVASAQIISALQILVSREVDPFQPAVVTVGSIHGGSAFNIIPETVEITGSVRACEPDVREHLEKRIGQIVRSVGESLRLEVDYEYQLGLPPVINDVSVTRKLRHFLERQAGLLVTRDLIQPVMVSEDFSLFQEKVPGVFLFLGSGGPDGKSPYALHHSKFQIDENMLEVGVRLFTEIALSGSLF